MVKVCFGPIADERSTLMGSDAAVFQVEDDMAPKKLRSNIDDLGARRGFETGTRYVFDDDLMSVNAAG
jgi:hypothetical protein